MPSENYLSELRLPRLWLVLVTIRLAMTTFGLPGYVHPDEFFQGPEPMAGDVFGVPVNVPWEFNASDPHRSASIPLVTSAVPFYVLRLLSSLGLASVTTGTLIYYPRAFMTFMSLVGDWLVYRIALLTGQDPKVPLLLFASSFVTLVTLTRPTSNAVETLLLSAFLAVLLSSLESQRIVRDEAPHPRAPAPHRQRRPSRSTRVESALQHAFPLGVLMAIAIFNRASFVAFAASGLAMWALWGAHALRFRLFPTVIQRLFLLSQGVAAGAAVLILIDSFYFRGRLLLLQGQSQNLPSVLVVAPLRFLAYNADASNLSSHGLHPWWLHVAVHLPLLLGPLIFPLLARLRQLASSPLEDPRAMLLAASVLVPLVALSLVPHQEWRFLMPLIVPAIVLAAPKLHRCFVPLWIIWNLLAILFFGYSHQGGVVRSLAFLQQAAARQPMCAVFWRTYMPPRHLLNIAQPRGQPLMSPDRARLFDLQGAPETELDALLTRLLDADNTVMLVTPSAKHKNLSALPSGHHFTLVTSFFPHFSGEDPPEWAFDCSPRKCSRKELFHHLLRPLSLHVYQVRKNR